MKNWEYDPVPRYFFYLGDIRYGEVIFDRFGADVCNNFTHDGEVWRAIVERGCIGRFSTLLEAQQAVQSHVMNRGLTVVR